MGLQYTMITPWSCHETAMEPHGPSWHFQDALFMAPHDISWNPMASCGTSWPSTMATPWQCHGSTMAVQWQSRGSPHEDFIKTAMKLMSWSSAVS